MPSFDIVSQVNAQEVKNAVEQANKEITNRYDFKGVTVEIDYDRSVPRITLHTADDYKLEAIWQVMEQRFRSRSVPLKNLVRGKVDQASGGTVRQEVKITQSIDGDTAKKITKYIKDAGYKKVQSQIQGDAVRVSAPSRDELQSVIGDLKGEDWGMELNFGNYR
jgi:cyclic-di-GMP-binding protein